MTCILSIKHHKTQKDLLVSTSDVATPNLNDARLKVMNKEHSDYVFRRDPARHLNHTKNKVFDSSHDSLYIFTQP